MAGWESSVFNPGRVIHNGFFRPLCAVRFNTDGDQARNKQLAMAGLLIRLYDRSRMGWGVSHLPNRNSDVSMIWQIAVTGVLVAFAASIVTRRLWGLFSSRASGSCGSCGGCSGKSAAATVQITPLVQLGSSRLVNQKPNPD